MSTNRPFASFSATLAMTSPLREVDELYQKLRAESWMPLFL